MSPALNRAASTIVIAFMSAIVCVICGSFRALWAECRPLSLFSLPFKSSVLRDEAEFNQSVGKVNPKDSNVGHASVEQVPGGLRELLEARAAEGGCELGGKCPHGSADVLAPLGPEVKLELVLVLPKLKSDRRLSALRLVPIFKTSGPH